MNNKVIILTELGDNVGATAPVIISASRSTDIPAFYAKWFFNRLAKGYCAWYNPFNQQKMYISFSKCRVIVFWTKNPKPIMPYLHILDEMGIHYYFQVTLNDYTKEGFEPNVPSVEERIETFKNLSEDEKKSFAYTLSLLLMNAAENKLKDKVEDIREFVDSKIDKMKKVYGVLSNTLKDSVSGFSGAVNALITGLSQSAQSLLDKAKTFVDSIKERLGINENGGYIQADFNVNIEVLMSEAENIGMYAKSIREICDDISAVYQSMDYSLRRYSIVPLKRIESSARKKANDCVKLSKSLNNVTNTYVNAENKLVGQF